MSSAFLLIIVVCCGYVHAGPYHGRRVPEIPQYNYELEESDNYEYPSVSVERSLSPDVDVSAPSLENSKQRHNRRNGERYPLKNHRPTNNKFSGTSNGKKSGPYNESTNMQDNRDIRGDFGPPKAKRNVKDDSGRGGSSEPSYSAEKEEYRNWNKNINTFRATDRPGVLGNSDEDSDKNDIMEKLEDTPATTEKLSEELVTSVKVSETTPREELSKISEELMPVTKGLQTTTEHSKVPPNSPELIIEARKASDESLEESTESTTVTARPEIATESPQIAAESRKTSKVSVKAAEELQKVPTKSSRTLKESSGVATESPKTLEESSKVITELPEGIEQPPNVRKESSEETIESSATTTEPPKLRSAPQIVSDHLKASKESPAETTKPLEVSEDLSEATSVFPNQTIDLRRATINLQKSPELWRQEYQCSNGPPKTNQRYSLSFPSTHTSAKPKQITTLHSNDELTLCWIETITTKEDKFTNPPKRLVAREYTVTFENSVMIPDDYLECPRVEGEIHPTNKEEAINTPFQEYFVKDTRKSKATTLQKVDHKDNLTIIEEKTIRCGIGSFIKKNIYEWLDEPDRRLLRVEVKVAPSLKTAADASEQVTTSESPDEVPSIALDELIDGTCDAKSTTAGPPETEVSGITSEGISKVSLESHTDGSCESGDCVSSTPYPSARDYADESSPEKSQEVPLVSEDLVCDNVTRSCGSLRSAAGPAVSAIDDITLTPETTLSPDELEDEPTFGTGIAPLGSKESDVPTETESSVTDRDERRKQPSSEDQVSSGENDIAIATRTTFPTDMWTKEPSAHKPRYALKLRVVLERIDENNNRETVVNLKKEVTLNHKNRTYMDQLDALNETVSDIGVIRDLLKCSAFEGISPIIWGYVDSDEDNNATRKRRSLGATTQNTSVKEEIVEQCLPDIRADISTGLNEIKTQLAKSNSGDIPAETVLPTEPFNFEENVEIRRSKRSLGAEDREAIGHWSNERLRDASDGGKIRSFTELVVFENN